MIITDHINLLLLIVQEAIQNNGQEKHSSYYNGPSHQSHLLLSQLEQRLMYSLPNRTTRQESSLEHKQHHDHPWKDRRSHRP